MEAKKKSFTDGVLKGTVVRHVMLPLEVVGEGGVAAGERWLVQCENNKEELVTPQELLTYWSPSHPTRRQLTTPSPVTSCSVDGFTL